jgi:hypothetical protein
MQRPNAELSTHFDRHGWHDVKHHQKAIISNVLVSISKRPAHDLPLPFFLYEPKGNGSNCCSAFQPLSSRPDVQSFAYHVSGPPAR